MALVFETTGAFGSWTKHWDINNKLEQNIYHYILGGNAIFAVENAVTTNHATYKVTLNKTFTDDKCPNKKMYFVSVCYEYMKFDCIGYLFVDTDSDTGEITIKLVKHRDTTKTPIYLMFEYVVDNYLNKNNPHQALKFYHYGICSVCGRPLTTPESVRNGMGPTCMNRQ